MKSYKAPDKKAPRFRLNRHTLTTEDVFDKFRKKYPDYNHYTNKQLVEFIDKFHEKLYLGVVENRDGIELPERLGHIFIGTCKPKKGVNPNRRLSIVYGKEVRNTNFETDNFMAKIFYTNYINRYLFADGDIWKMTATREFKKKVGSTYPKKWKMYHIIDNLQLISDLYNRKKNKLYIQELNVLPETYNEFEL